MADALSGGAVVPARPAVQLAQELGVVVRSQRRRRPLRPGATLWPRREQTSARPAGGGSRPHDQDHDRDRDHEHHQEHHG
jgi:hypothetical protein